jgi:hypothetical protein
VGVGVDGPPGVDVVAGPDVRPLHPVRQQPHPRRRLPGLRSASTRAATTAPLLYCPPVHGSGQASGCGWASGLYIRKPRQRAGARASAWCLGRRSGKRKECRCHGVQGRHQQQHREPIRVAPSAAGLPRSSGSGSRREQNEKKKGWVGYLGGATGCLPRGIFPVEIAVTCRPGDPAK